MSTKTNDSKDGAQQRERAVADGDALRAKAVDHARQVGEAIGLADAPVSPGAPPPHPAPPVPAPPYPKRALKETLPATPRALARQVDAAIAAAPPEVVAPPPMTETATNAPDEKPPT